MAKLLDNPLCFSVIKEVVFVEPAAVDGEKSHTSELQETDSQTESDNSKTKDTSNNGILYHIGLCTCANSRAVLSYFLRSLRVLSCYRLILVCQRSLNFSTDNVF